MRLDCRVALVLVLALPVWLSGCLPKDPAEGEPGTWKARSLNTSSDLSSVIWTGEQLVAVGWNSTVATSPDGLTWNLRTVGVISKHFDGVVWTGNRLVAFGSNGHLAVSPDGGEWTMQSYGAGHSLRSLVWTGTQLVGVGHGGVILTSPDGDVWTSRPSGTNVTLRAVTWTGNQLVAVGSAGTVLTSPDGAAWTPVASGVTSSLEFVVWTGAQLVAVTGGFDAGVVLTSPDGATWTIRPSGAVAALVVSSAAWVSDRLLLAGLDPHRGILVLASSNATTWRQSYLGLKGNLYSFAWTGSRYVAVGARGLVLVTQDP